MKRIALLLTVCLSLAAAAEADRQVLDLNPAVYDVIQAGGQSSLSVPTCTTLKTAIWSDGELDESEKDLLQELTQSNYQLISVRRRGDSGSGIQVYPALGQAALTLRWAAIPPQLVGADWENRLSELVSYADGGSQQEGQVVAFLQDHLSVSWAASNFANRFKPLRDRIRELVAQSAKTPKPVRTRELLRKALVEVDRQANDKIPDFLYSWV